MNNEKTADFTLFPKIQKFDLLTANPTERAILLRFFHLFYEDFFFVFFDVADGVEVPFSADGALIAKLPVLCGVEVYDVEDVFTFFEKFLAKFFAFQFLRGFCIESLYYYSFFGGGGEVAFEEHFACEGCFF